MLSNNLSCPKCGGPRTRYPRCYARPGGGGRWQYQCRICYNAQRRQDHGRAHPRKSSSSPRQRWAHNQVARAIDWYVRTLLSQNTSTPPSAWPGAIVNLKRSQLQLKRILWTNFNP